MKIITEEMTQELDLKIDPSDWPDLELENEEPFYFACIVDIDGCKQVISDMKKIIEFINKKLGEKK